MIDPEIQRGAPCVVGSRVQVAMLREMAAITFESLAQEALGVPEKVPSLAL